MSAPLSCAELVELVTSYLDGALDEGTAERVRDHLALCDGCAEYVEQMRVTVGAVPAVAEDQLDAGVRDRLLTAFRDFHRHA
jgi:anti-sigma factor RsiW